MLHKVLLLETRPINPLSRQSDSYVTLIRGKTVKIVDKGEITTDLRGDVTSRGCIGCRLESVPITQDRHGKTTMEDARSNDHIGCRLDSIPDCTWRNKEKRGKV